MFDKNFPNLVDMSQCDYVGASWMTATLFALCNIFEESLVQALWPPTGAITVPSSSNSRSQGLRTQTPLTG